ncbi:MAG: flippase-like domain-containing protein [Nitrospirales bacterium]|nr:flippase-like domain-containing protein [Nitrospirales bacterium]
MSNEAPRPELKSPGFRKILFLLLKAAVSLGLLIFLWSRLDTSDLSSAIARVSPWSFGAAVVIYLLSTYISALRWRLLVPFPFTTGRLFSLYIIGSFFNTCMPGTIGGDAVKAYYMGRELKGKEGGSAAVAVASVFMDRYMGLAALLFIPVAAMPLGLPFLETIPGGLPLKWLLPLGFACFLAGTFLLFRIRIGERVRFLMKIYDYLHYYSSRRADLLNSFLYSILIQVSGSLAVYLLARGMGMDISFVSLLVFVPFISLISFLPVSISGLGVREGAFVFFLGSMGVPASAAISLSLLWFLSVVAASLWGGFEYWRYRQKAG